METRKTAVATILSGNSEALIAEAIRSVAAWVDGVLLIDPGITDGSRRIAEELVGERCCGTGPRAGI